MAFPQVAAVNGGTRSESTSHAVNLPADIEAGDLLLVFFACDEEFDNDVIITFPEGWTQLFQKRHLWAERFGAWYRIADGEEGATITVSTSVAETTAHTSYRITGYSGTPEAGTAVTGGSTTPNPPNLTPTWGAKDTLWFAAFGRDGSTGTLNYPTDYTNGRLDMSIHDALATARRELNATSENPGVFTSQFQDQWIANTIAIQPEEVAAPQTIEPSAIAASSSVQAPSASGSGSAPITLSAIATPSAVQAPAISGSGSVSLTPSPIVAPSAIQSPQIVHTNQYILPSPVQALSAIVAPIISVPPTYRYRYNVFTGNLDIISA